MGQGFVTRPGKCRRGSDASVADVWRSIRDNGSGWTRRSMARIFPGCDCVHLINRPFSFFFEGGTEVSHCLCCLPCFTHTGTRHRPTAGWELPNLHSDGGGKGPRFCSQPSRPLPSLRPSVCIVFKKSPPSFIQQSFKFLQRPRHCSETDREPALWEFTGHRDDKQDKKEKKICKSAMFRAEN